ncbi:MAG: helix-turn-helix domain-containing protein [bacterium]
MNYQQRTQQVLEQFGLSSNEARVYQSALQLGETSPFGISKSTGIARTTVYTVLTDLALKGLIELESATGLMKQQTKVRAKNPSVLREILWGKRASLVQQEVDIVEILPFLKKKYLKDTTNADFQFFPGMEGANHVMFDYDGLDQDIYVFDYQIPMDATGSKAMNAGVDKGIKLWAHGKSTEYNLTSLTPWSKHVLSYQVERNPHYLDRVQYRTLPFEMTSLALTLRVKGNRVWIVSVKGDEVWGLKIRSQNLADSLVSIHQALWKLASPITKDMISSWGPNEYLQAEKNK